MFVLLMNAKKTIHVIKKLPCLNWGLCIQRAVAEKLMQIEFFNWFYLISLFACYEIKLIKTSKTMKGNDDSKHQQSTMNGNDDSKNQQSTIKGNDDNKNQQSTMKENDDSKHQQ